MISISLAAMPIDRLQLVSKDEKKPKNDTSSMYNCYVIVDFQCSEKDMMFDRSARSPSDFIRIPKPLMPFFDGICAVKLEKRFPRFMTNQKTLLHPTEKFYEMSCFAARPRRTVLRKERTTVFHLRRNFETRTLALGRSRRKRQEVIPSANEAGMLVLS